MVISATTTENCEISRSDGAALVRSYLHRHAVPVLHERVPRRPRLHPRLSVFVYPVTKLLIAMDVESRTPEYRLNAVDISRL